MSSKKQQELTFYTAKTEKNISLPNYGAVKAGFPSPAEDFTENSIDLNDILIRNKETTFIVKVHGESMKDAGIEDGDLLLVDKSLEAKDNRIAICYVDGEFTVKRIKIEKTCVWLIAENKAYKPIKVEGDSQLIIWGIVTNVIKSV